MRNGSDVGQNIINNTINLRSLIGTGDVTLTQNADDIEISSPTLNNIGTTGPAIFNGLIGNQYQFKNIAPATGIRLLSDSSNVFIINEIIQSANNNVMYNYGQTTSISLLQSYISPSTVISNIGTIDQASGTIVQTNLNTIDYTPTARPIRSIACFCPAA